MENTEASVNERGEIRTTDGQRTQDPCIWAIGDVTGGVMLAHRAVSQARAAAASATGRAERREDPESPVIPAVVFTDPELAWCGLTENEAAASGRAVKIVKFPWGASGRALTMDRPDGVTKLVTDPVTERLLGVGVAGVGAGELIGEGALAVAQGLKVGALRDTVHAHPTLSETLMESAELFFGHAIHTLSKKR